MKKALIFWAGMALALLLASPLQAQTRHLITFTDKSGNTYSVNNPEEFLSERAIARRTQQEIEVTERDLPVNPDYVTQVNNTGATVLQTSRWLNGALVLATEAQISEIGSFSFVANTDLTAARMSRNSTWHAPYSWEAQAPFALLAPSGFGDAEEQNSMLGVNFLHNKGFRGQGMRIAVFDSGFDSYESMIQFRAMQVVDSYDFVDIETDVNDDDDHGSQVLSTMAADIDNLLVGTAPEAEYCLYRTENVSNETRFEEFFWLLAAERADSVGVDVINASLYYTTFNDPEQDYVQADMDGETALCTRAANWAAETGMLVVVSAGNSGNDSWGTIGAPGDAEKALTVGSVNLNLEYVDFSSPGPTADGRIKPDVVALGPSVAIANPGGSVTTNTGTSFSSPLIAGFAACLWQEYPDLTAEQLHKLLQVAGSNAESPNSFIGYGVPTYQRAQDQIDEVISGTPHQASAMLQNAKVYPNPVEAPSINLQLPKHLRGQKGEAIWFSTTGNTLHQEAFQINANTLQVELPPHQASAQGFLLLKVQVGSEYATFKIQRQ